MRKFKATSCSLLDGLEIVPADMSAWNELSEFHYRRHGAGAVDKVFAARPKKRKGQGKIDRLVGAHERTAGVIVYAMPVFNVAARNRATGNRYVGLGDRATALRLINQELRCISRVVIHPQYRRIGLARRLVEQTLPLAGTEMVEALAVMGKVNPFFERAGMTRYDGDFSGVAQRMAEAFEHVGIEQKQLVDPEALQGAIDSLGRNDRRLVIFEMCRFAQAYGRSGRKLTESLSRKELVEFVSNHVLSRPVYFLWSRQSLSGF